MGGSEIKKGSWGLFFFTLRGGAHFIEGGWQHSVVHKIQLLEFMWVLFVTVCEIICSRNKVKHPNFQNEYFVLLYIRE